MTNNRIIPMPPRLAELEADRLARSEDQPARPIYDRLMIDDGADPANLIHANRQLREENERLAKYVLRLQDRLRTKATPATPPDAVTDAPVDERVAGIYGKYGADE